jgi:hypothetical protein
MTNSYWKQVLHVVVDYVKDLRPENLNCAVFANPYMDARALFTLLNGNVNYLYARNGNRYLYCFVHNEANIDIAKFILKSNGMNPKLHISRYYAEPMLALRVPESNFDNYAAAEFKKCLLNYRMNFSMSKDVAVSRLQEIRQHMAKQRTK